VVVLLATGAATGQGGRPGGAAPAASPVVQTVDGVANAFGMLRGRGLGDAILSVEYEGTGTEYAPSTGTAQWPAYPITKYNAAVAHDMAAMRVELERTAPNGMTEKQIRVVSGKYAWDESEPGAGLVPGKGTVTPKANDWAERALESWMMPHAFVKAARSGDGAARLAMEGGAAVVTVNVPNMPGVTMKATINARKMIDRVESRFRHPVLGDTVVAATYSNYHDIGGTELPSDILFPGRIVRTLGGKTVFELTVAKGNPYNPYVLVPVPDSINRSTN
jgi:hypothetical protein